ncbi:MAG TPA: TetR/AcrR family transcriptional regulator [Terriglobales bacterium]|nr:TetR/AcrR family transcriptional regulator [Terriglobales bacterium]
MMRQSHAPALFVQEKIKANGFKRAPGRPRSEDARKAILRSTLKLLQETGFPDLSIEAIAADADVGKATVYRWWPNKAALVADAFSSSADRELRFPNTGSVRSDVSIQMKHLVRVLRGRRGRIVAALIGGGQSDPELIQAFRDRFMMPRRQEAYATLRRGISRGELTEDLDLDLALDTLYGALYMRFLIRQNGLTEEYVDEVVGLVMNGVAK